MKDRREFPIQISTAVEIHSYPRRPTSFKLSAVLVFSKADGGPAASSFLANAFHIALAKSPLLRSDPKAALLDVWQSMDDQIYRTLLQVRRAFGVRMFSVRTCFLHLSATATCACVS